MNNDVSALSDFYKTKINPFFILQESFSDLYKRNAIVDLQEWYEYDLQCLNELLVQEGLGDALKSVGQKIGGAVKGVGDFAMKKLFIALGKILAMGMSSEEERQKLKQEAESFDANSVEGQQQIAAGQKLLGAGGNEASEEVYESTHEFLLATVFSEHNLREFFTQSLLTEAKAGRPKDAKTSGKTSTKPAKPSKNVPVAAGGFQKNDLASVKNDIRSLGERINKLQSKYKKQLSLNQTAKMLSKITKLEFPQPFPRAQKQAGQLATQGSEQPQANNQLAFQAKNQLAAQDGQLATQDYSYDSETGQPQLGQGKKQGQLPSSDDVIDAEYTEVPNDQQQLPAPQQTKGLFQKIMGYVKAHPRITSSVAIALIAAAVAASGGTMLPLVISGMSGATIKGGLTALQTKKEGGKVDWNKTVDAAFTGGAKAVGAAAAGEAIGGIAKHLGGASPHDGGLGANDAAEAQADAETHDAQYGDDNTDRGDEDYSGGTNDVQADAGDFQKYNGERLDPKSWRDNYKMNILSKLKREGGGSIDANKYNNAVKKLMQLGNAAKGKSIEAIMGESYTVQYLGYF